MTDYIEQYKTNKLILDSSRIPYTVSNYNGSTVAFKFREVGKPPVDFYPYTGKWKLYAGTPFKTFSGGANLFLHWYKKL